MSFVEHPARVLFFSTYPTADAQSTLGQNTMHKKQPCQQVRSAPLQAAEGCLRHAHVATQAMSRQATVLRAHQQLGGGLATFAISHAHGTCTAADLGEA